VKPRNGDTIIPMPPSRREIIPVHNDRIPVLDTAMFDHMYRVATAMAQTGLAPESISCKWVKEEGEKGAWEDLPLPVIVARCFKIVNIAVRWDMDPFMLMDCVSIVHDKICYEGKVIHAAIEQCLGIRLDYAFNDAKGRSLQVTVSGKYDNEEKPRQIKGTVEDWHKGPKSPWHDDKAWERQLRYRGAREWCRAFAPGVLLGVYADDEIDEAEEDKRLEMRVIDPGPPPPPRSQQPESAQPTESVVEPQPAESAQPAESVPPPPPAREKRIKVRGENKEKPHVNEF
jgi:hypothetical protein